MQHQVGGRHVAASGSRRSGRVVLGALSTASTYAFGLLAIVAVAAVGIGGLLLHYGVSPVLTGSMRPTFAPGDAIITKPVDVRRLHPGMVAVFVPPGESAPFAHRIKTITGSPAQPVITTQGDANPAPDAWHAKLDTPQVGTVVAHLPKVGYLLVWLHDRLLRVALIGFIGLLSTFLLAHRVLRADEAYPSPRRTPAHA